MTQNNIFVEESPRGNMNSYKSWREKEARIMFSLIQGEYENSKELSLFQRYKELERIIQMFTSEPVLMKMKWLCEDDEDEQATALEEPAAAFEINEEVNESGDCDDDKADNGIALKDLAKEPVIFSEMRQLFSKIKMLSFPPTSSTSECDSSASSIPTSCTSCGSTCNCVFTFQPVQMLSANSSTSTPTTPVYCAETPRLATCHSWPVFKRYLSESFVNSCDKADGKLDESPSMSLTNCHRAATRSSSEVVNRPAEWRGSRRNGIEMCVIKKDDIPSFAIPPLKTRSSKSEKADVIVPSLYMASTSKPNSPRQHTIPFSKLRIHSSSSIDGYFKSIDSSRDLESQTTSSAGNLWTKLRNGIRRESMSFNTICSDDQLSCSSATQEHEFDINRAHEFLIEMKNDFENINDWNLLSRYRKMKKMLKKGYRFASK